MIAVDFIMDSKKWVERETAVMEKLEITGQKELIAKAVDHIFGVNHYFIPAGLDRKMLIKFAGEVGIKVKFSSSPNRDGEEILTETGILECDLSAIMIPKGSDHRPFNLDADEHLAWAKEQGGSDITTAEEALYLLIRVFRTFGKISFIGKWIRCRNHCDPGSQLLVGFWVKSGLRVRSGHNDRRSSDYGAVAQKFTPLAV